MTSRDSTSVPSIQLLKALYPPPARVGPSHARGGRRGGVAQVQYSAIPSVARARIVVSTGSGRASARAIARQLSGRRTRTRLARLAVAFAARIGVLDWVPGSRLTVTGNRDETSFEHDVARRLDVPTVHLTFPVGPPRANRKPILQISDARGDAVAYAKVGHNLLTRSLVRAEGRALRHVADANCSGIVVPRVCAEFDWHGNDVLVMTPLPIPRRRLAGAQAHDRMRRLATQIALLNGSWRPTVWCTHPLRERLWSGFAALGERARPFRQELESLDDNGQIAVAAWHGDFNPGNVALVSGPCPVWDWERFEGGVAPGFDILHHDLHRWITMDGVEPTVAAERLLARSVEILSDVVAPETCALTARAYLLTLAERYLRDNQERAGAGLGAVTTWLLPALQRAPTGRSVR